MKPFKILLLLLVTVLWSCSKDEISKGRDGSGLTEKRLKNSQLDTKNSSIMWDDRKEIQLQNLTNYIGYLMRIPEVREEIHRTAETDFGAVSDCLWTVLIDHDPLTPSSPLAEAFFDEENNQYFEVDALAEFAINNKIRITAPYLAENFGPEENNITVTYYYPGMYDDRDDDPEFIGETPGMYIPNLNEYHPIEPRNVQNDISINNIQSEGAQEDLYQITVNDDYASAHPTIVVNATIVYGDDPCATVGGGTPPPPPEIGHKPFCSDLDGSAGEILEVQMPAFALQDNIRRWPNANLISCWVATGEFEIGSNGVPKLNANLNYVLHEYRVSRKRGRNQTWLGSNISFIIHNWKYESEDMYLVWGSRHSRHNVNHEVSVSAKVNDPTNPELKYAATTVSKPRTELISGMNINKCALLMDIHYEMDKGFGTRNDSPIYGFGKVRTFFKLNFYD